MRTTFLLITVFFVTAFAVTKERPIFIHPKAGSRDISTQTTLLYKFQHLESTVFEFDVWGEKSGPIPGEVVISGNTVIFKPSRRFAAGEKVHVRMSGNKLKHPLEYDFMTTDISQYDPVILFSTFDEKEIDNLSTLAKPGKPMGEMSIINGVAVPADFPKLESFFQNNSVDKGKIFLNNWVGSPYIMIFENDGTPYFYQRVEERARDFKVQANGQLTRRIRGNMHCFVGLDKNYAICDTFRCIHGYGTDEHELIVSEDGHYFLIALGYRTMDMSKIVPGGKKNANIIDNHVQEFDPHGNLVFEWLSHQHFRVQDAVHENLKDNSIDYVHMNSIGIDYDGHIIISSRHLSEVTKIHRQTGDIIWRFGGRYNQFTLLNDKDGISYQHHAAPVEGKPGHYTIFDNGNYHDPPYSRGVEFYLDTEEMTAEKVWEYRHKPERYSHWMGNTQRLPNGNTLINWADGSLPKATEVTPSGRVVLEADFVEDSHCYRTFKFDFENVMDYPYLIGESYPERVTLIFNKFGDKNIREYQVYGDQNKNPSTLLGTTSKTYVHLTRLENNTTYYFRVRAVDKNGNTGDFSNQVRLRTNYLNADGNFVQNGNFDKNLQGWELYVHTNAKAYGSVDPVGAMFIKVMKNGSIFEDIQLRQSGIPLIRGRKYVFEFDAWAERRCALDAKLIKADEPWINYGQTPPTMLSTQKKHFAYEFMMQQTTDYEAQLLFGAGLSGTGTGIYIDSVSVSQVGEYGNDFEEEDIPESFTLGQNYPNPFNPATTISYSVPDMSQVTITLYNIIGQKIGDLVDAHHMFGNFTVDVDASDLSAGVYFYRMEAQTDDGKTTFSELKKMTVVR